MDEKGLRTSGKPEASNRARSSEGSARSGAGITESTPASTRESRSEDASAVSDELASGSAMSQATMSAVIACSTEPKAESTVRTAGRRIRSRSARPR